MNLEKLQSWHESITKAEAFLAKYSELFHVESPVIQEVHALMTALTKSVSEAVGDTLESLEWYWLENDMGKRGLQAGTSDSKRKICTVDDLLWLLEVTA